MNVVTLRVRAVDGPAEPEAVSEAYEASVHVDRSLDHETLLDELEGEIGATMEPFALEERVVVGSWGADWSGVVLDVMTAVGGFAGALYLVEKVALRLRGEEERASRSAIDKQSWERTVRYSNAVERPPD